MVPFHEPMKPKFVQAKPQPATTIKRRTTRIADDRRAVA